MKKNHLKLGILIIFFLTVNRVVEESPKYRETKVREDETDVKRVSVKESTGVGGGGCR